MENSELHSFTLYPYFVLLLLPLALIQKRMHSIIKGLSIFESY